MTPTLSQIREWDTAHLEHASRHWCDAAGRWEDAFVEVSRLTHLPGGTPWEGKAALAAQHRAHADRRQVSAVADRLYTVSTIARTGAQQLQAAKQRIVAIVADAEAAGFSVGEDFSLTTYRAGAQAIAAAEEEAREFGRQLRSRIEDLIALDRDVAARITSAAATVDDVDFTRGERGAPDHDTAVQFVDNRVLKEAPPQPPPPDPTPGPLPPVTGADDVRRVLEPLQNGGRRGSNDVGTEPRVKEVWDATAIKRLWDYLTRNGADGELGRAYDGTARVLPDGTKIGLRLSEEWGDTIDVVYPDGSRTKAHIPYEAYFPPLISGLPQLPAPSGMPIARVLPPQTAHPPTSLPPSGIFEANGLPPWLQNPSAPGHHTPAQMPTIMPGVAMPETPVPSSTVPEEFAGLPVMGGAFVDAGRVVGSAVVGGVVIVGELLGTVATPSGQIAR
jgi:hypothetical protein